MWQPNDLSAPLRCLHGINLHNMVLTRCWCLLPPCSPLPLQLPPCAEDTPVLFNVSLVLDGSWDIVSFYEDLQEQQMQSASNCMSLPGQISVSSVVMVQLRAAEDGKEGTGSLSTLPAVAPPPAALAPPPAATAPILAGVQASARALHGCW